LEKITMDGKRVSAGRSGKGKGTNGGGEEGLWSFGLNEEEELEVEDEVVEDDLDLVRLCLSISPSSLEIRRKRVAL